LLETLEPPVHPLFEADDRAANTFEHLGVLPYPAFEKGDPLF
jgi:hypothetical protein